MASFKNSPIPFRQIEYTLKMASQRLRLSQLIEKVSQGGKVNAEDVVKAWLDDHSRKFGNYINCEWVLPDGRKMCRLGPLFNGVVIANSVCSEKEDAEMAVATAKVAYKSWSHLPVDVRVKYIFRIAKRIIKYDRLFTDLDHLENGPLVQKVHNVSVNSVMHHLHHHWTQLTDTQKNNWKSLGVVAVRLPALFDYLMVVCNVLAALAMGNTIVLKPPEGSETKLSAFLFVDVCAEVGLPPGVLSLVTGDDILWNFFSTNPDIAEADYCNHFQVKDIIGTAGGDAKPKIIYDTTDSPFAKFTTFKKESSMQCKNILKTS